MKRLYLILLFCFTGITTFYAQGFGYDSKIELENGLYKVKSGDYYGIIDKDENVVVSIEYQDILLRKGKALLTKEDVLLGIIDSVGNIKSFNGEYKVHPRFRYVYEGFIPVSQTNKRRLQNKWGYIDEYGAPLRMKQKMEGTLSAGKKYPTLFDEVTPFVNGCACVYLKKGGWIHIDKEGRERYRLSNKKSRVSFRSSVYKDECIIVTDEGIKQYQENNSFQAVVKRILASSASLLNHNHDSHSSTLIFKEGTLTLDSLRCAVKYENEKDSIIFIEKPRKVIVKKAIVPVDTFSLKDDLRVELTSKNLQANAKGRAYTEVKIKNISHAKYEDVSVSLECAGTIRAWNGDLEANSEVSLSFNLPARFSTSEIRRNIRVEILYKEDRLEKVYPVTIKRYTPVRSR